MERLKNLTFLQRTLLLFWALFYTLVLASNLTNGLQVIGWLPPDFPFVSGNYGLMEQITGIYRTPNWLLSVLFLGVLAWEGWTAVLFWRAFQRFPGERSTAQAALSLGMLLAAAFVLMDELFLAYRVADLEKAHLLLFTAEAVTLILINNVRFDQNDQTKA